MHTAATTESRLLRELLLLLEPEQQYTRLVNALRHGENHYTALQPDKPVDLASNHWLQLQEGSGMPLPDREVDLSFHAYLSQVITPVVEDYRHKNPLHPFDDRKFRLCHYALNDDGSSLQLSLGPTEYQQYRADIERPQPAALERMLRGMREAGDPYHYFSKMMGITAIVLSREGYAYAGERVSHIDHPGLLQFIAGAATFHADLTEVDFKDDIRAEIRQETGWEEVIIEPTIQFIGIAGQTYTSELDLVFLLPTQLDAAYFQHPRLSEHERMLCLQDATQVHQLLTKMSETTRGAGTTLLYPTHFGLSYLLQHHWKSVSTALLTAQNKQA
jgi:hypothetical protein